MTRIINGVKFDYEVSEITEKELIAIAAQDVSFYVYILLLIYYIVN